MNNSVSHDAASDDISALGVELLSSLEHGTPLKLDRRGQFSYEAGPITDVGASGYLRRNLDRGASGETIARFGEKWAYVLVSDLPLRVLNVNVDDTTTSLHMDDGRSLALDPATLRTDDEGRLRCQVPSTRAQPLDARFTREALVAIESRLECDGDGTIVAFLHGGERIEIPRSDAL